MRGLLASLMVLAAALGAFVLGSSNASFTATNTEAGVLNGGTAIIRLNDQAGVNELVWQDCNSAEMSPGDTCTAQLGVFNDGSVWLAYTVAAIETACFDLAFTGPFDLFDAGDGNTPGTLPPPGPGLDEIELIDATATLVGGNECQDVTEAVGIRVDAVSIPTPPS
jgi:hypothetical protein